MRAQVCRFCSKIRLVENLLNLVWLVVVALLVAATIHWHARGRLTCSLPLALGCVMLLAVVLFPALSMTDDLQRSQLVTEGLGSHGADSLLLQSLEDLQHIQTPLWPLPMLMLLWAACLVAVRRISRDAARLPGSQLFGLRFAAIRPPPCA